MKHLSKSWGKPSKAVAQLLLAVIMAVALLAAALPAMSQGPASPEPTIAGGETAGSESAQQTSPVKWRQSPDMQYGVNVGSIEGMFIVADDWMCMA